jgi:NAD(P)-dependent dehydrogenase (short-subunit alcohol dehydrogenase family)
VRSRCDTLGLPLTRCTSSIGSVRTRAGGSAYQVSKSAVNRFAEFVHAEYAETGVRAFSYHPGAYASPPSHVWRSIDAPRA